LYSYILDIKGVDLPRVDVLTYSFPCQDLSSIGNGAGLGVGTRSGLRWEVKRILEELQVLQKLPKFLLMENVKNILSAAHYEGWNEFATFLETLGYKNTMMNINALEVGIPQSRDRVFCVSELNGKLNIAIERKISNCDIQDFLNINCDEHIVEYKASMPNHTPARIAYIDKSKKLNDMSHCMTITTKADRSPNPGLLWCDSDGKLINNEERDWSVNGNKSPFRFLTPREALMLMGFDSSDYDLLIEAGLSNSQIYFLAGNSIVVPKLEAIFIQILKILK